MSFNGFDAEAVALLGQLPTFDKARYDAVSGQLKAGVRTPGVALIETVAAALDPCLTVDKRRSVSPLHRDLRFAPEGASRYKDHLLLTTWQGADKKTAPMLWLRIDAECVGFASGIGFTPKVRNAWREAVASETGAALADAISAVRRKYTVHELEVAGDALKRVPKPWSEDHPRAELLRLKGFQVRFRDPLPDCLSTPAMAAWCVERLTDLLPIHHWLVKHLSEAS